MSNGPRIVLVVWLATVWVMLWGAVSVPDVIVGVLLGALLVVLFPLRLQGTGPVGSGAVVSPLALLRLVIWFAGALLRANVAVAAQVMRPRLALSEGIVAVPLRASSPLVVAAVANTITLTPGTLTVEMAGAADHGGSAPVVLYVHCLVTGDPERVRAEGRSLEARMVDAFGTATDRAAIEERTP